ncbi:hypothetical protein HB780_26245 [Rhizobium lusitanum]|uniref:hypothetical protein n=1 Tax=Rhizobium lusitanum TaxID=293958 RepID=UPI0016109867|nr:hypothetical protein [Rhizobium lusitanum]QND49044.1 hypothetical protein HB780_26245 [Rhizobium lusitanum]
MLSPVAAVSVVGASIEKPVVATAETSSVQAAATPLAILSSAVNASAGDKLNMLLMAARDRMFESLLSAIDAASVALNVPREPGESNAALAQRLVDAIRSLPPQQLAAAQQQLNTQAKMPVPLPLLAAALDNPDSPQAVQIAVSLDASLTQEPDAIIKAVVNSYGQNAGEPDAVGQQQSPAAMPRTSEAASNMASAAPSALPEKTAALSPTNTGTAAPTVLPEKMAAPSLAPATALPSTPAAQAQQQTAAAVIQAIVSPAVVPVSEAMPELEAVVTPQTTPNPQGSATPQAANVTAERGVLSQIAVMVEDKALSAASLPLPALGESKIPTEIALIRSPLTPPPVPRDIQQLQADIKQGLQVVISPAIDLAGPDLPQVTRSDMPLAERVIAQALAASQPDLQPLPQTVRDESVRNLTAALAGQAAVSSEEAQSAQAAAPLPVRSPGNAPIMTIMDMSEAVAQAGTTIAPLLGIPFAIAHYLPAEVPAEDDPKRVNRVDLVDEEREQGQGGEAARDDSEDEPSPEETDQPASSSSDPVSEEAAAEAVSASAVSVAPKQAALPAPAPADPLSDHAFDFYRRMVGWE